MNYAEYIIGLGAGILITLIVRAVNGFLHDKALKKNELESKCKNTHDRVFFSYMSNESLNKYINELRNETDMRISALGDKLTNAFKIQNDRIDQHAGRIEKLESKRK